MLLDSRLFSSSRRHFCRFIFDTPFLIEALRAAACHISQLHPLCRYAFAIWLSSDIILRFHPPRQRRAATLFRQRVAHAASLSGADARRPFLRAE
jgi:hypothetical protein